MTTLTIKRTSLGLNDLVIPGNCEGPGYWLGAGVTRPEFKPRYGYAPDSAYVGGKQLLSVVKEAGSIVSVVYAKAANQAALAVLKTALEDALWQFSYTVALDDGVTRSFEADPTSIGWGEIVPGHDQLIVARGILSIPVNP